MKKKWLTQLALMMILALMIGCTNDNGNVSDNNDQSETEAVVQDTEEVTDADTEEMDETTDDETEEDEEIDSAESDEADDHLTGHIRLEGTQLFMNDEPFYIQGVCWNPVGKGDVHPGGLDFAGFVEMDAKLMQDAGINTIRTYEPITDTAVLDVLYEHGVYVINTVYPYGGNSVKSVETHVEKVKDHPAILMWCLGNEWNYNGLYVGDSLNQSTKKINEAAALIKAMDSVHPITTVYGNIPSGTTIKQMPDIDIWGLNVYSGLSFGSTFSSWSRRTDKPMYMAEYGADAWNARTDSLDLEAQAEATQVLTLSLMDYSSVDNPEGVCLGGTIFEFADEWWKDNNGTPDVQDAGGIAPGGGPHPDNTFNEEYWGIVDIDRNPRPAYEVLKEIFTGE